MCKRCAFSVETGGAVDCNTGAMGENQPAGKGGVEIFYESQSRLRKPDKKSGRSYTGQV